MSLITIANCSHRGGPISNAEYLWFDPGEHTGWCIFDELGDVREIGTCNTQKELHAWLIDRFDPDHVDFFRPEGIKHIGIEEFKLYPWKSNAQMWNEFITCQVIGAIKLVAQIHGIPVIMQPANKKGMGCMYLGIKEPPHSNPLNHQIIAMAHGVYYLQSNGIRKPQQGV